MSMNCLVDLAAGDDAYFSLQRLEGSDCFHVHGTGLDLFVYLTDDLRHTAVQALAELTIHETPTDGIAHWPKMTATAFAYPRSESALIHASRSTFDGHIILFVMDRTDANGGVRVSLSDKAAARALAVLMWNRDCYASPRLIERIARRWSPA
jgi:hypothetical protein